MKYVIGFISFLSACLPDLGAPQSLIFGPRILSVRSEPPEVFPDEKVQLSVVAVEASGELLSASAPVEWAFCTSPKRPVENNVVDTGCLGNEVRLLPANVQTVSTQVPSDACALFGPQSPPSTGESGTPRPRDPDETGGYYQPVRVSVLGLRAIGLIRIRCGLASATPEVAARFRAEYQPNRNPDTALLHIHHNGQTISSKNLPAGQPLLLRLVFPNSIQETYLRFDPAGQSLAQTPETLRTSWLSAQGSFQIGQTWATPFDEKNLVAETLWTAPEVPGSVLLHTVLRDSRGGVLSQTHPVEIKISQSAQNAHVGVQKWDD